MKTELKNLTIKMFNYATEQDLITDAAQFVSILEKLLPFKEDPYRLYSSWASNYEFDNENNTWYFDIEDSLLISFYYDLARLANDENFIIDQNSYSTREKFTRISSIIAFLRGANKEFSNERLLTDDEISNKFKYKIDMKSFDEKDSLFTEIKRLRGLLSDKECSFNSINISDDGELPF